jgi:iduronate 2-sulfatase
MNKKTQYLKSLLILTLAFASHSLRAEITVVTNAFAAFSKTDTDKTLATIPAQNGDYLAILTASNQSSWPAESSPDITLLNGATLGTLQFADQEAGGTTANIWYAPVNSSGDISINITNGAPEGAFFSIGAYVIRATDGETIEISTVQNGDDTTFATGLTNTYTFATNVSGVVVEGMSTYDAAGTINTGLTLDHVNSASKTKRSFGTAPLSDATSFESSYALSATNSKISIHGMAFTSSGTTPVEPPPIASPDRTRLHPADHYNVLFIPIDDMRPLINAYGETEPLRPITPHMDRLAASGVMFSRAHCQQAVCNASRASLLTGLRPDSTRCWKLSTHFRTPNPNIITLPQHFGNNGYRVHGIGKIYHNTNATSQDDPLSWNEGWSSSSTDYLWYDAAKAALEDAGTNKVSATDAGVVDRNGDPITDEAYNDGYAAAQGVIKIAEYAADYQANGNPFFLAVGFMKPHLPFNCPKAYWNLYEAGDIDLATYTGLRKMPIGTNKFTAPYGDEPKAFLDVTGTSDSGMPTATEARELIHGYLACVSYIDAQIGKLLDALEDPDGNPGTDDSIVDNTIVILWGDHGFHLGDHNGFWAKHSNFEISARVPLIVSTPALAELGAAGTRCTSMVELVDIYPTLLDLCSLPAPNQPNELYLEGTTFLPLLEDPRQPWKQAAFSQYQRSINQSVPEDVPVANSGAGMGYSIRTERYRYTEWWKTESADETDRHIVVSGITVPGHIELYDYVEDPAETTNLASNAAYTDLIAELHDLLNDDDPVSAGDGWKKSYVDAPAALPTAFTNWQSSYLYPGRTTTELEADSDPDGDNIPNNLEYKFGTHPLEPDEDPISSNFDNGRISFTYPDVEARTNVLITAETTINLITNAWTTVGIIQTNLGQQGIALIKNAAIPTDQPEAFLRLKIETP